MEWTAPRTFDEYMAEFPEFHRGWLQKHHPILWNRPEEQEDAAQHLLLRTLEMRRVEKYDPKRLDGKDTPGLFLSYMGMCFRRDMNTRWSRKQTRGRKANELTVSIDEVNEFENLMGAKDNEVLSLFSQEYRLRSEREAGKLEVELRINEFRDYVAQHRPDLVPSLDALISGAVNFADKGSKSFPLRSLYRNMEAGTVPYDKRNGRRRATCKRGHARTPENLNRKRSCKLCDAERVRKWYAKKAAANV